MFALFLGLGLVLCIVLFILICSRLVLSKPVPLWALSASGPCVSCGARCWPLWCTDPVQHPSEQLASGGTGPTILTVSAGSVTAHYTPIRWLERSNIFLLRPCGHGLCREFALTKCPKHSSTVVWVWWADCRWHVVLHQQVCRHWASTTTSLLWPKWHQSNNKVKS